jgi:hypothetical protein
MSVLMRLLYLSAQSATDISDEFERARIVDAQDRLRIKTQLQDELGGRLGSE